MILCLLKQRLHLELIFHQKYSLRLEMHLQYLKYKTAPELNQSNSYAQWSKWPKFVSLHYWHAPRGAVGVEKFGRLNWSPLWWVRALRFSQNWRNCEELSKLNKNCQRIPVFWRFFEFHSISHFALRHPVYGKYITGN